MRDAKLKASDFLIDESESKVKKSDFTRAVDGHASKKSVYQHKSSIYANDCNGVYGLSRVLFYNKFNKQVVYHKQRLKEDLRQWRRVELTFLH